MGYKTLHRKIRIDQHEIIPLVSESHSCPSLMRFDSQDMWIAVNSKFFLLFIKFQIIVFNSRTVRTNSNLYACICIKKSWYIDILLVLYTSICFGGFPA
jgi:hypothetical protein